MNSQSPTKLLKSNDIPGAVRALAVLNIVHPENDNEYGGPAGQILEDHCPELSVPSDALTPAAQEHADALTDLILTRAHKLAKSLEQLLSKESALAVRRIA
jgi:hypothetical protein